MTEVMTDNMIAGESTLRRRLVGAMVLIATASVIGLAAWLTPSAKGHGTHEQLGLAPCSMLMFTGKPCVTCGYTTAFSHVAHGHLMDALKVQPAGAMLAMLVILGGATGGFVAVTGTDVTPLLRRIFQFRTLIAAGGIVLAAWAYKLIITP